MAGILFDQGKLDESLKLHREALEMIIEVLGETNESAGLYYRTIGEVLEAQDKIDEATTCFERSLDIYKRLIAANTMGGEYESSYNENIARILLGQQQFEEALSHFEQSLDLATKIHGKGHTRLVSIYNGQGTTLEALGRFDRAMEMYQHALRIDRKANGDHHRRVTATHAKIANLMVIQGDVDGAMAAFNRIWGWYGEGCRELSFISILIDVGAVYKELKKFETAMEYFQRALNTCQDAGFQDLLIAATAHAEIGNTLMLQGKMEESLGKHKESLVIKQKIHGEDHSSVMFGYCSIANLLVEQGDFDGAMTIFQRSLDWFRKRPGKHTTKFVRTLCSVGRMYVHQEKYDKAIECFQQAVETCPESGFEDLEISGMVHSLLGWAQKLSGNLLEESAKSYRAALRIYSSIYGQDHVALAGVNSDIGEVLALQNDLEKAKEYIEKAKEICWSRVGENTALAAEVTLNLGLLKHKEGAAKEALELIQLAEQILSDTAHTWQQKDLWKKTKRAIEAIETELGTQVYPKEDS